MIWYTGMCEITAIGLLYMLTLWSTMGIGSNGCFMAGADLMGDHYRKDIISGVGHPRSDSDMSLVLCVVAYNIRGTCVVLQVLWDSTTHIDIIDILFSLALFKLRI
jgi:hypothetical protein